jgi:predicted nuclease of restriction endonuclease-like RecB superfamily
VLGSQHVHVRRRGDLLTLVPLTPEERQRALELAEAYVGLAGAHVGRDRASLLEAVRQLPVGAREQRLAAGLWKLVLDRCTFSEDAPVDPAAVRAELFTLATTRRRELGPRATFDREAILAEVAAARGVAPALLQQALYADLPDAHLLTGVDLPGPRALVAAYEASGAQAVLLRAVEVRVRITHASPAAFRALFRKLKFLRLLHRIEPLPGRGRAGEAEGAGYDVIIDGPFSLFESVTKYGLQLALAFPAIAACGRWALEADVRWGKERRPLRFTLRGDDGEAAGADADEGAVPPEVAEVLEELRKLETPWRARPATAIVDLPGAGVCVPDLELTHVDTGRSVYVEVLGFWSRDAVWRRIELAERGLPVPIVFAVSKHLRVSEAALPAELPAALYVYARAINARALLERAERAAAARVPAQL